MQGRAPKQVYSRVQVRRVVGVSEKQLQRWEKLGLIPPLETFAFSDLIALRTLARLRDSRIPTSQVRRAVAALRKKLQSVSDPLRELKIFNDGQRITVQVGSSKMEPISGQLLLNFDQEELQKMVSFPGRTQRPERKQAAAARQFEAALWFEKALELEQAGAPVGEVIETYQKVVELDPKSAGALLNLGTVHFHMRAWDEAEHYYKRALEADPSYALAHFNLGNLFDEKNDRAQAILHYLMAIRLNPSYGDAHYNLALLYQSGGQMMQAVPHWKAYLKLDSTSPWAAIARQELEKVRRATIVSGSRRKEKGPGAGSAS